MTFRDRFVDSCLPTESLGILAAQLLAAPTGLLAAAAGQVLLEAFQIGVGLAIGAVWVSVGCYLLTEIWPI